MKKFLLLALGAVILAGCGALSEIAGPQIVGSGKVTTVSRHVGAFKKVQLDGAMDADITVGTKGDVKITGDDNIAPLVKTEIKGDILRIYLDGNYSTHTGLKVQIPSPELTGAQITGSGDVVVHGANGDRLELGIRGSGSIKADGSVHKLDASISGSGDLNLFALKANDAQVKISGSGGAEVTATSSLSGSISGSGDITYRGKPAHVAKSISGSGDINPASE